MCFFSIALHSQSADFVTELIGTEKATYGQVSYLAAVHQGFVDEGASYEKAFAELQQRKQVKAKASSGDVITYKELARTISKLWKIKGGLMFRATKGSARYAFQQFKIDGIVPKDANPTKKVSGADVLNVFSKCEYKYGGEK